MKAKGKIIFKVKGDPVLKEILIPSNVEHLEYVGDPSILSRILSSLRGNPWRE